VTLVHTNWNPIRQEIIRWCELLGKKQWLGANPAVTGT